jgi:hypothetical protein
VGTSNHRDAEDSERGEFSCLSGDTDKQRALSLFEAIYGRRPELIFAIRPAFGGIGKKKQNPLDSPGLCGESSPCI